MTSDDTFAELIGLRKISHSVHMNADLIPLEKFRKKSVLNKYKDNTGFGRWATKTHFWPISQPEYLEARSVRPSDFLSPSFKPPYWATHVVWYKK